MRTTRSLIRFTHPAHRQPSRHHASAGTVMTFTAVALLGIVAMAALTIDVGKMAFTKSKMQGICDFSALAGAGTLATQTTAQNAAAMWYLSNVNESSSVQPTGTGSSPKTYTIVGDTVVVTTPYSDTFTSGKGWDPNDLVKVQSTRTVPLAFASALGISSATVNASAVALCLNTGGVGGDGEGCLFATDQGFAISCNNFTVKGSVYTNSSIAMSLNNVWIGDTLHGKTSVNLSGNNFTGHFGLEYGTTYSISCNTKAIASYTQLPQVDITPPITYVPANYASDFNIDYTVNGNWNVSTNNFNPTPGTYYVNGNMSISCNNANLQGCTFIVNGSFSNSTNNVTLSPSATTMKDGSTNYMCVYLLGSGTIAMSTNNTTVNGDLYAPNGYISNSSNNIHKGWWVARRISISCNNFELDGIPGRGGGQSLKLVE